MLGVDAGERRGQVVAKREPVARFLGLRILLPRKHTGVRAVDIRQEGAQRLDRFHGRRFQRIEAIAMIDRRDLVEHRLALNDVSAEIVAKALGRFRLGARGLLGFGHGPYLGVTAVCL